MPRVEAICSTHRPNRPNPLLGMANSRRRGLRRWVQEHRSGREHLVVNEHAVKLFSYVLGGVLHPPVVLNSDNCKKGAVHAPRSTNIPAIGSRAIATGYAELQFRCTGRYKYRFRSSMSTRVSSILHHHMSFAETKAGRETKRKTVDVRERHVVGTLNC